MNLGTGRGHTVLEAIAAYRAACGRDLAHRIVDRRPGDPATSYADVTRAAELLDFRAEHDLAEMCASNWAFSGRAS